tara:strand:+ start:903 stop:1448 length:546 start_codon:yes stop_codon:yes gene_type:complete
VKIKETTIEGCYLITHDLHEDKRGLFFESYNQLNFDKLIGRNIHFVQDNVSISKKSVLRGLHYQKGPHAQAKLVTVLKGEVIDVIVDIRKDSPTFGNHFKIKISSQKRKSIFIPKGMAHGFLALTDDVIFSYKCDALYDPKSESGILYNDPKLFIDWEIDRERLIISEKDLKLPLLKDLEL